jgi:hypothetical protein
MKKRLYIATPINARLERDFTSKYLAAKRRVEELKETIFTSDSCNRFVEYDEVVSSFDLNPLGKYSEAQAMGRCIEAVMDSDAIYLDQGWKASSGCILEYSTAKIYGKTIIEHYSYDDLQNE